MPTQAFKIEEEAYFPKKISLSSPLESLEVSIFK